MNKLIIIGAGPAGMMAAIRASQLGHKPTLIEKNSSPGKKLLLSGKGRCNLTNACDIEFFLKKFSKNGEYLRDAFKHFFYRDLMHFFEERGVKLKIERQQRVFPDSDNSRDIVLSLERELKKQGVNIIYNRAFKDIRTGKNTITAVFLADGSVMPADKVILATGGVSYSETGSTGDGIAAAKKSGHRTVKLRPGLVPLIARQKIPTSLDGFLLKNVRLTVVSSRKRLQSEVGEVVLRSFGISGALVFDISSRVVDWLDQGLHVYAEIDFKPALSYDQLDQRLIREFIAGPQLSIKGILKALLPSPCIDLFVIMCRVDGSKIANQITQAERKRIIHSLKALRFDIIKARPIEEAMITRGGVSLKDINPRTMESRVVKGLYFAGEMIDVDADTGGFNLQACFSTGYLAGENAART